MMIQWAGTRRAGPVGSIIAWTPNRSGPFTAVSLSGALTFAGALSVRPIQMVAIAGAVTFTGSVAFKESVALVGSLSFSGLLHGLMSIRNAIQTRYRPRPLLTLTIGAETTRYSTEDIEVPGSGAFGGDVGGDFGDDFGG